MVTPPRRLTLALCAALAVFTLVACGKSTPGGTAVSSSAGQSSVQQASGLTGVAAAGAPLTGSVSLSDSSFPSKSVSAVVTQSGAFSFSATDLQNLKAPYLLKAQDGSGNAWYSFAGGAGTANINPLTNLALAVASGSDDVESLSAMFDSHNGATLAALSLSMPRAMSLVVGTLQPLLATYGAAGADPLAGFYAVNSQGLDGFLGQVDVTISQGTVTMTDKTTVAPVFSAPLDHLEAALISTGSLSSPAAFYLPGNAILTLATQGTLPAGAALMSGTFTLQLPLGITVDTGPSGINTAIPIGVAAQSNVYPAPVLSQTNNQLSVIFSSPEGFGTGDFLNVRCVVSTAALFATTAADFSVAAATLYGDIYKSQRVSGISIVPVALVYPTREGKAIYDTLCASCHTLVQEDTSATGLYGKAGLISARFTTLHHGVALTATQQGYLTAYLSALFSGEVIF